MPDRKSFSTNREYNEYYQKYRDSNREKIREHKRKYNRKRRRLLGPDYIQCPDKVNAWNKLNYAIKIGKLSRLPCEKCGNVVSEAHHEDYSKPLKIIWLCTKHHSEHHWRKRKLARRLSPPISAK